MNFSPAVAIGVPVAIASGVIPPNLSLETAVSALAVAVAIPVAMNTVAGSNTFDFGALPRRRGRTILETSVTANNMLAPRPLRQRVGGAWMGVQPMDID